MLCGNLSPTLLPPQRTFKPSENKPRLVQYCYFHQRVQHRTLPNNSYHFCVDVTTHTNHNFEYHTSHTQCHQWNIHYAIPLYVSAKHTLNTRIAPQNVQTSLSISSLLVEQNNIVMFG